MDEGGYKWYKSDCTIDLNLELENLRARARDLFRTFFGCSVAKAFFLCLGENACALKAPEEVRFAFALVVRCELYA